MRVNYPLKRLLYAMQERNVFDMSCATTKFCVSFIVLNTVAVGMTKFIAAWNCHFISGIFCHASSIMIY